MSGVVNWREPKAERGEKAMADREKLLLDLFVEIARVEQLVRNYLGPIEPMGLSAEQFGLLNYFIRNNRQTERRSILAWVFQTDEAETAAHLDVLAARGLVDRRPDGTDEIVALTPAGQAAHEAAIEMVAPDVLPLMSEFADDDLGQALTTLQEIRRVFDNLPDRPAAG